MRLEAAAGRLAISIHPLSILEEGVRPVKELLFGSAGGVLAALVGGWRFVRRDVL